MRDVLSYGICLRGIGFFLDCWTRRSLGWKGVLVGGGWNFLWGGKNWLCGKVGGSGKNPHLFLLHSHGKGHTPNKPKTNKKKIPCSLAKW